MLGRVLGAGLVASSLSALAAAGCSRVSRRHATAPVNAIAHIYDGGRPPRHGGRAQRNTVVGFAVHTAASLVWALFFESAFGKAARRSPMGAAAGGAITAALACFVDYRVVGERLRPGYERHLSRPHLAAVYGALAVGLALYPRLERGLHRHQVEDRDEGDERRNAEGGPRGVETPV